MEEKKVDRRIRKTKKQLRAALTTLMMEKDINDITVREIAELADVNRGTFYAHYRDVRDLLTQLEENIFASLEVTSRACDPATPEEDAMTYLEKILTLCAENADVYRALVCRNGDVDFQQRLFDMLKNLYLSEFLRVHYPENPARRDYFCTFIVSGMLAITSDWLLSGARESPREVARMAGDFIRSGLHALG